MSEKYVKQILNAAVYDVAEETPVHELPFLSMAIQNRVLVKREDLQPVFSFKLRGAYNKICKLSPKEREYGIVAASAGNHAQGVALSARKLHCQATIVMPVTTPAIKVRAVRKLGGRYVEVVLRGDSFDESNTFALDLATKKEATYIHPYDDPDVIAGQGTIGMEILRQVSSDLHAVFVPVGGGGLIAGIGSYIKYLRPDIKVIGVEADDSACLKSALEAGRRVILKKTGIFADGVAVARVGKEPFRIAKRCVDEVLTVNSDEICAAIKDLFDDTRSIAEPAGALALAGLKLYAKREKVKGQQLLAVESGANINFDRLRYVSERYEIGQHTEVLLGVTIPESPGSLVKLCEIFAGHDISEFNYRYSDQATAHVFVGVHINGGESDRDTLQRKLQECGFVSNDMTDNALAKLHVCHMIGGHAGLGNNEHLYRFEFPEREGVLKEFLTVLRDRWNISLFHYRRHGGSYANVFVGLQEIPGKKHDVNDFLMELGYSYVCETNNPAYCMFLK